jgi:ferritin-like metal-binding protein YciE
MISTRRPNALFAMFESFQLGRGAHLTVYAKSGGGQMKWLSEDFKNLRAIYTHQLRELLSAEEQVVRALPNLIVRATDEQLRQAFQFHLQETEGHIQRLEQILSELKSVDPHVTSTGPGKCKAMTALVAEADDLIMDARDAWVRDAGLIAAAQRVEHYEMASYGTLRQWARVLGESSAADLLDKTLQEEGNADHLLSSIAERINPYARLRDHEPSASHRVSAI